MPYFEQAQGFRINGGTFNDYSGQNPITYISPSYGRGCIVNNGEGGITNNGTANVTNNGNDARSAYILQQRRQILPTYHSDLPVNTLPLPYPQSHQRNLVYPSYSQPHHASGGARAPISGQLMVQEPEQIHGGGPTFENVQRANASPRGAQVRMHSMPAVTSTSATSHSPPGRANTAPELGVPMPRPTPPSLEERFQVQIKQLQEMGFTDTLRSVNALVDAEGDVNDAAVSLAEGHGMP